MGSSALVLVRWHPPCYYNLILLCGMIEVQLLVCLIEENKGKIFFDRCFIMRVSRDVCPDRTVCPS